MPDWLVYTLLLVLAVVVLPILGVVGYFGFLILKGFVCYRIDELALIRALKQRDRFRPPRAVAELIREHGGTLITDSTTLGWNLARLWWVPADLRAIAPSPPRDDEDLPDPNARMWPAFDQWCIEGFLGVDTGSATLVCVRQVKKVLHRLSSQFPEVKVVHVWSGGSVFGSLTHGSECPSA